MAKGATFDNDILNLIFNGTSIANLADNAAASPLAVLYVALHTADPTTAGNQSSNEISYTGYNRIAVNRNSGGWTVSGNSVSPAATIAFGACTGGSGTASYLSIGTASSGTGKILWYGALSPTIAVANGVTPQITATSTVTET
jgi:hypothetical protein